jgi:phosphoglycerol geranylgeranyltransferase
MYKGRNTIYTKLASKTGQIAVLIDPEKSNTHSYLNKLVEKATFAQIDFFFIGGSTVTHRQFEACVKQLKQLTTIPLVLFPGASHQVSEHADALLFLNLISGRNPDFLIGHQVQAANELQEMDIEIIPTGYILVDGGKKTSVQYVSQTAAIPQDNFSIARSTALAGKMMGNALLYFDAGSGAITPVPENWIHEIKQLTNSPIIVGGGIKDIEQIDNYKKVGANVIVIGNHIEENIDFLLDIKEYLKNQ